MRWSPGPISQNIEDRRFQWTNDPEGLLLFLREAAERGDPMAQGEVPPWMDRTPRTQEALVGGQNNLLDLARLLASGGQ